jgi:hypothetical protein
MAMGVNTGADLTVLNLTGLLTFNRHLKAKNTILGSSRSPMGKENPQEYRGSSRKHAPMGDPKYSVRDSQGAAYAKKLAQIA